MPKKAPYEQKFRPLWLNDPCLKNWLTVVETTQGQKAKCKHCNTYLTNRYAALKLHSESQKHKSLVKIIVGRTQQKIPFKPYTDIDLNLQKAAEAQIALYVTCHSSINACDHLNNICKKSFKNHTAADNLQIHRTKCTNIIKNVFAPHFVKDLDDDLKDMPYSLLIDESTDVSVTKYLGIVIIYYSKILKQVVETFLDMPELPECNAEAIVTTLKDNLLKHNLKIKNLRGLGTDNASVMVGVNNGVYAKLKEDAPNLVLVR